MDIKTLKVFSQYSDRNDYPIGQEREDGAFDIIAEVHSCGGTEENCIKNANAFASMPELYRALKVVTEDPKHLAYFIENDPQALKQMMDALRSADHGKKI